LIIRYKLAIFDTRYLVYIIQKLIIDFIISRYIYDITII